METEDSNAEDRILFFWWVAFVECQLSSNFSHKALLPPHFFPLNLWILGFRKIQSSGFHFVGTGFKENL